MLDRTRKWYIVGAVVLLLIVVGSVWAGQKLRPFGGEFENVGMVEVDGTLDRVLIFCLELESVSCKHLWKVEVERAEHVNGQLVSTVPKAGATLAVEVEDSRANLFHGLRPDDCFRDRDRETSYLSAVRICEYPVTQTDVLLTIVENIGSSGQPEWSGVPR